MDIPEFWRKAFFPESHQMQLSKAQQIAMEAAPHTQRRSGIDKARLAAAARQTLASIDEDLASTQLIECSQEQPMDDEPLLDEDSDDEEFNAHAEEIFLCKLDDWFAEYAPKLFDLAFAKNFAKAQKKQTKQKEESSEISRPKTKKRRT